MGLYTGTIPTELGTLTRVTNLDFTGNLFTGTVSKMRGRLGCPVLTSEGTSAVPAELTQWPPLHGSWLRHHRAGIQSREDSDE